MKYSKLPWSVADKHPKRACLGILDAGGNTIASLYDAHGDKSDQDNDGVWRNDHERMANAEFIVTACNAHEQLVAALKKTQALLFLRTNEKDDEAMAALQQSRAALAAAGAA